MQILNYCEQSPSDTSIAIFDCYSPKMRCHFRNLKLKRSKKGHIFISFPTRMKETGDKKEFIPHYEFDGDLQKTFQNEILAAVTPYIRDQKTNMDKIFH